MTIQEAIKSGKYFHRSSVDGDFAYRVKDNRLWDGFLDYSKEPPRYLFWNPEYSGFESLNAEDILADDWEIIE